MFSRNFIPPWSWWQNGWYLSARPCVNMWLNGGRLRNISCAFPPHGRARRRHPVIADTVGDHCMWSWRRLMMQGRWSRWWWRLPRRWTLQALFQRRCCETASGPDSLDGIAVWDMNRTPVITPFLNVALNDFCFLALTRM